MDSTSPARYRSVVYLASIVGVFAITLAGCQSQLRGYLNYLVLHPHPVHTELLVKATINPQANRPGWFTLTVKNMDSEPITFVDIPEGAGNDLWHIELRTSSGKTFQQQCTYAPFAPPETVVLKPQESCTRDFQAIAYLPNVPHSIKDEACSIAIHYRNIELDDPDWRIVHFSSEKTELRLCDLFPHRVF
ncbi:MAG: hypothetical protein CMJ78_21630 [Planctomycetaceae bacterium]|nr:hypothetical protein [Planctomycetaceae bacterium]